jgi:hypothetical protein
MRMTRKRLVTLALSVGAAGLALGTGARAVAAAPLPAPPGLQGVDPQPMAGQNNGFVHYGFMNPGYDTTSPVGQAMDSSPRPAYPEQTLAGAPTAPRETPLYTLKFYKVADSNAQNDNPQVQGPESAPNSDWDGVDLILLPGIMDAHWYMYCGSDQRHQGMFMERQAFKPGYGFEQTLHGGGDGGDFWVRWYHHLLFLPWGG